MENLCGEYVEHYHQERPHQGLDNELIATQTGKSKKEESPASRSAIDDFALRHPMQRTPWRVIEELQPQSRLSNPTAIGNSQIRSMSLCPRMRYY